MVDAAAQMDTHGLYACNIKPRSLRSQPCTVYSVQLTCSTPAVISFMLRCVHWQQRTANSDSGMLLLAGAVTQQP